MSDENEHGPCPYCGRLTSTLGHSNDMSDEGALFCTNDPLPVADEAEGETA